MQERFSNIPEFASAAQVDQLRAHMGVVYHQLLEGVRPAGFSVTMGDDANVVSIRLPEMGPMIQRVSMWVDGGGMAFIVQDALQRDVEAASPGMLEAGQYNRITYLLHDDGTKYLQPRRRVMGMPAPDVFDAPANPAPMMAADVRHLDDSLCYLEKRMMPRQRRVRSLLSRLRASS